MSKLDSRWFKEDRANYKGQALKEQSDKTRQALLNSSLLVRILKEMLQEDIDKTFLVEENFDDPAWQLKTIAAAAERKALRRIIKLLP